MITDRFTARILGAVILLMTVVIDVGCFLFTKPEISHRPTFPLVVFVPSLPMIAIAVFLFRRANRLKPDSDDR